MKAVEETTFPEVPEMPLCYLLQVADQIKESDCSEAIWIFNRSWFTDNIFIIWKITELVCIPKFQPLWWPWKSFVCLGMVRSILKQSYCHTSGRSVNTEGWKVTPHSDLFLTWSWWSGTLKVMSSNLSTADQPLCLATIPFTKSDLSYMVISERSGALNDFLFEPFGMWEQRDWECFP